MKFEQKLISRIFAVLVLAGLSFGLYSTNKAPAPKRELKPRPPEALKINLEEIDSTIDTFLVNHGIAIKRVRKKAITNGGNEFTRIERQVPTPPGLMTILMNAQLHAMAKKYGGRAIASENLKENSVSIHIEVEHRIVESLVLRPAPWIYETPAKETKKSLDGKSKSPGRAQKKSRSRSH